MARTDRNRKGEVLEKTRPKTGEPEMYHVVIVNDDYTPMDFVTDVLESIFSMSPAQSYRVMMHVHTKGRGVAGTYTFDVAETKAAQVHELAEEAGHPLRAAVERA